MLTTRQYTSIHQIADEHWDGILDVSDVFHRHSFIRIVEDSRVENARFHYLLIYDDDQLIATTVLSAFRISLDLFISKNRFVTGLKKIFPNLFSVKILVCGLPASFGQLNIKLTEKKYAGEVGSIIAGIMKSMGKEMSVSLMTVKEFKTGELQLFDVFEKMGFFPAQSIPYMNMKIHWKNFAEYLSSLKHSYRRRILLSLKKIGHKEPVILSDSTYDPANPRPALVLTSSGDEHFINEFYRKYLEVMKRTPIKLETLNREFFINLFEKNDGYKLLNLVVAGDVISSAIVIFAGDELVFMLVAKQDENDQYDSYFNLVYGIIALAIQSGSKKIRMGQTAYWVKQCVGAVPEPELIYFAARNPVLHWLLKSLRNIIFPEIRLKLIDVFRNPDAIGKKSPSRVSNTRMHEW